MNIAEGELILRVVTIWAKNGGTFRTHNNQHFAVDSAGDQVISKETLIELVRALEDWCVGATARRSRT